MIIIPTWYLLFLEKLLEQTCKETGIIFSLLENSCNHLTDNILVNLKLYHFWNLVGFGTLIFVLFFFGVKYKLILGSLLLSLILYNFQNLLKNYYYENLSSQKITSYAEIEEWNPFFIKILNYRMNKLAEEYPDNPSIILSLIKLNKIKSMAKTIRKKNKEINSNEFIQKELIVFSICFIISLFLFGFIGKIGVLIIFLGTTILGRIFYLMHFKNDTNISRIIITIITIATCIALCYFIRLIVNGILAFIFATIASFYGIFLLGFVCGKKKELLFLWVDLNEYTEISNLNIPFSPSYTKWIILWPILLFISFCFNLFLNNIK